MEKIVLWLYYQLALHVCIVSFTITYIYSILFLDIYCCFINTFRVATPVLSVLFLYKLSGEIFTEYAERIIIYNFWLLLACSMHHVCDFVRVNPGSKLDWGGGAISRAVQTTGVPQSYID